MRKREAVCRCSTETGSKDRKLGVAGKCISHCGAIGTSRGEPPLLAPSGPAGSAGICKYVHNLISFVVTLVFLSPAFDSPHSCVELPDRVQSLRPTMPELG